MRGRFGSFKIDGGYLTVEKNVGWAEDEVLYDPREPNPVELNAMLCFVRGSQEVLYSSVEECVGGLKDPDSNLLKAVANNPVGFASIVCDFLGKGYLLKEKYQLQDVAIGEADQIINWRPRIEADSLLFGLYAIEAMMNEYRVYNVEVDLRSGKTNLLEVHGSPFAFKI